MNNNDDKFQPFFSGKVKKLFVEIPSEQKILESEIIKYWPLDRGRVARNIAGGTIPWWVLIFAWIQFGGGNFCLMIIAIMDILFFYSPFLFLCRDIPILICALIMFVVLRRGTLAKLSSQKGEIPWWVFIFSWTFFEIGLVLIISLLRKISISFSTLPYLFALVIPALVMFSVLYKETLIKLSSQKKAKKR